MPQKTAVTQLSDKHYGTVVIRLLFDVQGHVEQGEVVDLNGRRVGHFRQLVDLPPIIARWLAAQAQRGTGRS